MKYIYNIKFYSPYIKQGFTLIISLIVYYLTIEISGIEFFGQVGIKVSQIMIISSIITFGFQENSSYLYVENKLGEFYSLLRVLIILISLFALMFYNTNFGKLLLIISFFTSWRILDPYIRLNFSYKTYFNIIVISHLVGSITRLIILIKHPLHVEYYLLSYYSIFFIVSLIYYPKIKIKNSIKKINTLFNKEWVYIYISSLIYPLRQFLIFNLISITTPAKNLGYWNVFNKFLDVLQTSRVEVFKKEQKSLLDGNRLNRFKYFTFILFSLIIYSAYYCYKLVLNIDESFIIIYFVSIFSQIIWLYYLDRYYNYSVRNVSKLYILSTALINTFIFVVIYSLKLDYKTFVILTSLIPPITSLMLIYFIKKWKKKSQNNFNFTKK